MSEQDRNFDDNGGGNFERDSINPDEIDGAGTSAPASPSGGRKKRKDAGQPRGPRSTKAQAQSGKVRLDLSSITGMFVGLHCVLAEKMEVPELSMTPEEGQSFMDAAQNVMRHYAVETTQKTLDWIAFCGVTCGIYLPRIASIMARQRAKKYPHTDNPPSERLSTEDLMARQFGDSAIHAGSEEFN